MPRATCGSSSATASRRAASWSTCMIWDRAVASAWWASTDRSPETIALREHSLPRGPAIAKPQLPEISAGDADRVRAHDGNHEQPHRFQMVVNGEARDHAGAPDLSVATRQVEHLAHDPDLCRAFAAETDRIPGTSAIDGGRVGDDAQGLFVDVVPSRHALHGRRGEHQ